MGSTRQPPALVGREPALAALRVALGAAAGGQGQFLLVAGEPGIGKTALVAALATEAGDSGALVAWGQCWEGEGVPAYWPWVQVLRAGMAAGGDVGDAALLLPERGAPIPAPGDDTPGARFRLFDSVVRHLSSLAAVRPVVVVLDDLQWADEASLAMVEFCARHLQAAAVLLLCTYRDEEAPMAVRRIAAGARVLPLGGLAAGDVASLLGAVAGTEPARDVAEAVWRRTAGNPLFVGELARLLAVAGGTSAVVDGGAAVPDSVREVLERRLARLSQPCAHLLTLAAVAGPEVRVDVLARASGHQGDVLALLDEAVSARVLVSPAASLGPYRFSHDLFRETIVTGIPAPMRSRLHLAVGRTLEALQEDGIRVHPAELAAHFDAAVGAAPTESLRYAVLAAEDAGGRLAYEEACAHYERGLRALDLGAAAGSGCRLELLLRLGGARERAGDTAAARVAYREAVDLARLVDDASGLARAAIGIHALGARTSHAEAIGLLEQAMRALPADPDPLRARVLGSLARDLHHSLDEQDWDRAPRIAADAVAVARSVGDASTTAFCLLALHDASWRPGTAVGRLAIVEEMIAAAHAAGDHEMVAQGRLLRATALIELGDPRGTVELETFCRITEELGHARARYAALSRRATVALLAGRVAEAEALAAQAFELGRAIGEPDATGVHETLLWAARRLGGGSPAFARLDSDPWPELPLARALVDLAAGDLDTARQLLAGLRLEDLPRQHDLELLAFATEAVSVAGTVEQREGLYAMLRPFAGTHVVVGGCASYLGAVDHYLGLLARSLDRAADGRRHLEEAAALHDALGARAWADASRAAIGAAGAAGAAPGATEGLFRREGDVWSVRYGGAAAHLPDAKGLRDLAVLLARPGEPVHAVELHTGQRFRPGADPVLDDAAKAAYRRRLAEVRSEIDEADAHNDPYRAEKARTEYDALLAELTAATGLGGRDRRLGAESERARKAVTARIRDALDRIERVDRALAGHLQASVHTGTWCTYAPRDPVTWRL